MYGRTHTSIFRLTGISPQFLLPQPLVARFREQQYLVNITHKAFTTQPRKLAKNQPFRVKYSQQKHVQTRSDMLRPISHQHMGITCVASTVITSFQQKELPKVSIDHSLPKTDGKRIAMEMVKGQLHDLVKDIHKELDAELLLDSELSQLAKYVYVNS